MADAKFFSKGKASELESEMKALDKAGKSAKKKDVLKRIIASMTMGTDMSPLFHQVIQCAPIPGVEVRKMIYMYLINYCKILPDLATLAVNLLIRDAKDPNPLTRAQALRTMSYIPTPEMIESMCDPLRKGLDDEDPFVRKTAVIAVCKLFHSDADTCEREGFLEKLMEMLVDPNPTVLATVLAVIKEVGETHPKINFSLNMSQVSQLMTTINECSEWYQVYILEALLYFTPENADDACMICERISPKLQHSNAAISLTAVRITVHLMNYMTAPEILTRFCRTLTPPLVTLMSRGPEIQFTTLRSIMIIMERYPEVLKGEIKAFLCKYNDPIYVKMAKLEVLVRLVDVDTCPQVLLELKEYASEVDVDFVRRAVRYIGRCAIQLEPMADACIHTLMELIETRVPYVLQEAVVVVRDVFRRYPNRYEGLAAKITDQLEAIDEPDAKAAYIWILGQYADRISNACDALRLFLQDVLMDSLTVQLSLLTASMKALCHQASGSPDLFRDVVNLLSDNVDNPDVRDRAVMYVRMARHGHAVARRVMLADRPIVSLQSDGLPPYILMELQTMIGTLAAVLHRPPSHFLKVPPKRLVGKDGALQAKGHLPTSVESTRAWELQQQQRADVEYGTAVGVISVGAPQVVNLLDLDNDLPGVGGVAGEGDGLGSLMGKPPGSHSPAMGLSPQPPGASALDALMGHSPSLSPSNLALSQSPSHYSGFGSLVAGGAGSTSSEVSPSPSLFTMASPQAKPGSPLSSVMSAPPPALSSSAPPPHDPFSFSPTFSAALGSPATPPTQIWSPSAPSAPAIARGSSPPAGVGASPVRPKETEFGSPFTPTTAAIAPLSEMGGRSATRTDGAGGRSGTGIFSNAVSSGGGGGGVAMGGQDLLGLGDLFPSASSAVTNSPSPSSPPKRMGAASGLSPLQSATSLPAGTDSILNDLHNMTLTSPLPLEDAVWLKKTDGKCLEVGGCVRPNLFTGGTGLCLDMFLENASLALLDRLALKLNLNLFGLQVPSDFNFGSLPPGGKTSVKVPLVKSLTQPGHPPPPVPQTARDMPFHFQAAIRTCAGIFYFLVPVSPHVLLLDRPALRDVEYQALLRDSTTGTNSTQTFNGSELNLVSKLCAVRFRRVRHLPVPDEQIHHTLFTGVFLNDIKMAIQIQGSGLEPSRESTSFKLRIACSESCLIPPFLKFLETLV